MLTEFQKEAVKDKLSGWELIEYLDVPIEDILAAALDNDWINEGNVSEVLTFIGFED